MTVSLTNITFDCDSPAVVAAFWSEAVGRPVDEGGSEFMHSIGMNDPAVSPTLLFLKVPEAKTAKNRMHLDVVTEDREREVQRLVELGAKRLDDKEEYGLRWTVMADPEANEFCVAAEPS
jgi:hypothetical protein